MTGITPEIVAEHGLSPDEYARVLNALGRLADEGRIRSTLTTALEPLDAATLRHAHALVESSATIGKVVVAGWPS